MDEGMKLAEMESLFTSVTAIVDSNAPFVMKWGASSFVSKHRAQQYPTFATLSRTIDEFTAEYSAANVVEARNKSAANFFGKLKGMLNEESRDHPDIYVCRGLRESWPEFWSKYRHFG